MAYVKISNLSERRKTYLAAAGLFLVVAGLCLKGQSFFGPKIIYRPKPRIAHWSGDVDARVKWVRTGLMVQVNEEVRLNASGTVLWNEGVAPPNNWVDANGAPWSPQDLPAVPDTPENRFPEPRAKCGSLVMKIGDVVYGVGGGASIPSSTYGEVAFMVN